MLRTIAALVGIAIASVGHLQAGGQQTSGSNSSAASPQRLLLNRYCVTCHNEKLKTAGLMLDKLDLEKVDQSAEEWEKVVRKLRTGAMPPVGLPRPDQTGYDSLATYLETALDKAALARPNPGRPALHRLNRAEYANAVRDLLALDIDGASLLPADDSGYGFDNIGDVLTVSPLLLSRYMSAARQISRLAIGDPTIRVPVSTYVPPRTHLQDERMSEDLPFGSRGGMAIPHYFPLDGNYLLKVGLERVSTFIAGLNEPHQLDVRLDGKRIKLFTIGSAEKLIPYEEIEAALQVRFPATAGTHMVDVAFLDESSLPEGMFKLPRAGLQNVDRSPTKGDPVVNVVSIAGPYDAKGGGESPSRRKIFVCHPTGAQDEDACAKKIITTLARRAYRRPVTDEDVQALLKFYKAGDSGFDDSIGMALQGMLLSPDFLFRAEHDPVNAPETVHRISDLELASRLSFFLWSSIPDDDLLNLAERGKLKDSAVLQQQVQRMLADPRSKALPDNFAGQWLDLRNLRTATPDADIFIDFDEGLRDAFQKEMELFLQSMLREDRSVVELLNANYTFVNERLARHYDIPNIYGSRFRRVTLADENRWGLMGKGAILTVTSYPNRTTPVLRGKWVLENILGTPPAPPPPNVPALQDDKDTLKLTMRQRMEQHRANPVCAGCHAQMDPIGFALESFDAIGKARTVQTVDDWNGFYRTTTTTPIDVSGALPDGSKFQGIAELRKILASRSPQFVTTVTEKLLTYALGRGVEYYDEPAVRSIMREAAAKDYRWSALILAIVKSAPFQMRAPAERTTTAGLH